MLRASVRLSVCLFPKSSETTERIHFKFAISDMQLCISVDTSNCYPFTFLVKKPLIFAAQKLIAYHWKGNRTTNALSTINDHYSDDLNTKNGKN